MNIRPQSEHLQRARFVPEEKRRKVESQNAERRERMPHRRYHNLHERFLKNDFPQAHYLMEMAWDFYRENGKLPNTLLYPSTTRTKWTAFCINKPSDTKRDPNLPECQVIRLNVVQSEFYGLEYRAPA